MGGHKSKYLTLDEQASRTGEKRKESKVNSVGKRILLCLWPSSLTPNRGTWKCQQCGWGLGHCHCPLLKALVFFPVGQEVMDHDAEQLYHAMKGLGTDEASLIRTLAFKGNSHLRGVNARFREKYGQKGDLTQWIKGQPLTHLPTHLPHSPPPPLLTLHDMQTTPLGTLRQS